MQRFRVMVMALAGLSLMVAMARAQEQKGAACESCQAPGKCVWVTETKKVKTPCYRCKTSEYCPSTISANSPCWAALCDLLWGDYHSGPRVKHQVVKSYYEKEVQVKKLKVVAPD